MGVFPAPLARLPSGAPNWPPGILGSLAHDDIYAAAAVARKKPLIGLGVDIEPAEPLPADLIDFVLVGDERRYAASAAGRLVFVAKEAVYKAINPLDATPLEYADIAVNLDSMTATLADGRALKLFAATGARLVAAALCTLAEGRRSTAPALRWPAVSHPGTRRLERYPSSGTILAEPLALDPSIPSGRPRNLPSAPHPCRRRAALLSRRPA